MATKWTDHILGPDTTANRPDPTAAPTGALYQNSDTGDLEYNTGSAWIVYRGAPSDASSLDDLSDVDLTTTPPSDGDTLVYDAGSGLWLPGTGGGSGGGSPWTKVVDLPLTSLTDWTVSGGSWSAAAGGITQATDSSSVKRLLYGPRVDLAMCIAEVEINIATSSSTASSRAGFSFGGTRGVECSLYCGVAGNTTGVDFEMDSTANAGQASLPGGNIAHGTSITFRAEVAGGYATAYVNGTLVGSAACSSSVPQLLGKFSLYSYATDATYRNLKVWTPTAP